MRAARRNVTVNARPVGNLWPRSSRRGLSLFEVVIALAVFVGSIAAIGQLISTGVRAAVKSRLQSQAVLRCESKMAEVVAGIVPLRGSANGQFPDDASWNWQVQVAAGPYEGLYIVEVTATHPGGTSAGNQSFALRRMIRDPQLQLDEWAIEQAEAASSSNSSANSSTSGSSSSGSTGGGS